MPASEMVERVRRWLEWEPEDVRHLEPLAACGDPPPGFSVAMDGALYDLLLRLEVPSGYAREIVDSQPTPAKDPEAWWLLERLHWRVIDKDGPEQPPPWPAPWPVGEPLNRYFQIYPLLAAVPELHRSNAARGIPEGVTWDTLRDLGLQVGNFGFRHGVGGFDGAFWMWPHFRGEAYRLGRLQYTTDDHSLGVHIPALGPLVEGECDTSLDLAREFFPRHFPELSYSTATCSSWLLDPRLASYLPATSNIIRFQERFERDPQWRRDGDDDVLRFVFGYLPDDLGELPQDTTLQRAVVGHLLDGGHWEIRRGFLDLR
jgi:hypothetical protein